MEPRVTCLCPKSNFSSLTNLKKLSLFSPSISHSPLVKSVNMVCLKTNSHITSSPIRGCLVQSSLKKVEHLISEREHSLVKIKRKKLAVFVSGGGSNFRSIHEACINGFVHGEIAVLVTNKGDCGGAVYARENGIQVLQFPSKKGEPDGLSTSDLVTALRNAEIDFVILAGYLKLIPLQLIQAYPRSILNIHPSLLPAFGGKGYYGMKVHKAVIASGARYSGPTIHFVDEHYDTGRILAQSIVPVLATDTAEELAARVLKEEHKLYVDVTAALCEERIVWRDDGVPLIQSKENPNNYC
ncbi:hypothetical protein SAY86_003524 [Trapa natans]|uniref:Phosphoribosylglycinamide formyltransferase, chloroplastic n=1 Tax=Trapa natans TaxID=22666 RepID=A0AAN7MSB1_TRANT|nr:hypothetical protein SAY86_003524 [Trapa natans]